MAQQTLVQPNPVISRAFEGAQRSGVVEDRMTLNGTVSKTFGLLAIVLATAVLGWQAAASLGSGIVFLGMLLGFGVVMVTMFKPQIAPISAPIYAVVEGFVLGAISRSYASAYSGVVPMAVCLTIGIFAVMLFLYAGRIIRPSENFKLGVAAATGGIMLVYLVQLVGSVVGFELPLINSNSTFGILFSLFVVALASANLVINFDFIEKGANSDLPKYMEWVGALGLLVTLVWLYLEILRLLSKLQSR